QAKLLRVIQERDFMRLGGMETIKVDVRIIAATNVDLRQMMEEGKFREDLFYRLHVISIQLPPLRDRKDDVPLLVHHFLEKYGEENRKTGLELTPEALDLLTEYDWPGNVRELENVIERAVVLTSGNPIGIELIPDHVRRAPNFQMPQFVVPPEGISFKDVITDFEKRLIESTLEAAGGVQKRAAELLHIKPTTLNEMIKRYEIRPRRRRLANGTEAPASAAQPPSDPRRPAPTVVGPRTQCSTSTALQALTRTGVPTDIASSASRERLSYGEGQTTTVAASSACRRSRSESMPAKLMNGSSGSDMSLAPISTSVASPPSFAYS